MRGPRIVPWGTPHNRDACSNNEFSMFTKNNYLLGKTFTMLL